MRRVIFGLTLAFILSFYSQEDYSDLYKKVKKAVVGIFAKGPPGSMIEYFGTGFFIHPQGYILTTSTTVPQNPSIIKVFTSDKKIYNAEWVATNEFLEASIIKIKLPTSSGKRYWKSLVLDDSNKVKVGSDCLTLSNDFNSIIEHYQVSMSLGVVSGIYTVEPMKDKVYESKYSGPVFETTASVNPGADGGPLINIEGKVIGLISLSYAKERYLGVAVPINRLKKFIKESLAKEIYSIPIPTEKVKFFLGWKLQLKKVEDRDSSFIEIVEVEKNSSAEEAGLMAGDKIVEFDLFKPKTIEALEKALELYGYQDVVEIKVLRGEEIKTLYLTLQPSYSKK
jgi:S1-C subfamily serine protease